LAAGAGRGLAQTKKGAPKNEPGTYDIVTETVRLQAKDFAPKRREPAFKGAFSVGLVLVRFTDTKAFALDDVVSRFNRTGSMSIAEYYKDYSQGITWPELTVVGESAFPQCVYTAPEPIGYYCRHDTWDNPLGYRNDGEGRARAAQLKKDARAHAFRFYKRPTAAAVKSDGSPHVVAYVYECGRVKKDALKPLIEPRYPKGQKIPYDPSRDAWELYSPKIQWSDPLWPNSSVQIHNSGDGGTLCHELGHVLGAPDYYHATEPHDGVGGTPCLPWAFGPTGPGYCRVIYQAFLPPSAYPMLTKDGTYTLRPRKTNPAGDGALGAFIPSAHPNYLFCLEYVKDETEPLGKGGASGLLIQVINVTLPGPFLGPPDLCYVYRPGDRWLHGEGNLKEALFGKQHGRPAFNMQSDPPARLPNLLDSGVAFENIAENADGTLSFTLRATQPPVTGVALRDSLLPKIELDSVTDILPGSAYAKATVTFRGEPLNTEYGFCWDIMQRPTCKPGKVFPLYHRDRFSGRILGLRPNAAYHLRAYIRSPLGVSYSTQEIAFKTPPAMPLPAEVKPLLEDGFSSNWVMDRWFGRQSNGEHFVGSCAMTGLLKLTAYYRAPMDAEIRQPDFDYTRIHTRPSLSRPDARMAEYNRAMRASKNLAWKAKLCEQTFPKDFDRVVRKTFGIKAAQNAPGIEALTEDSLAKLEPLIRAQVAESKPVVVVQESIQPLSPTEYALMLVLIDGYNEKGQFHLVFPTGRDRGFSAKTGWHPLSVLLENANAVKAVFGMSAPLAKL
jgi:M6 family metalloprotease-like protein